MALEIEVNQMKNCIPNSIPITFIYITVSACAFFLSGTAEATPREPVERAMSKPICETFTVKEVFRVPRDSEPSGAESSSLGFTHGSRIFGAENNGWINTPYSRIPELERSRPGDHVLVCLVKYYAGCPKGDDRGRTYSVRNLRTGAAFEASNGSHICGGA